MRLDLWLAQPKTGVGLRTVLRGALCVCGAWIVIGAYGLGVTRRSLEEEQSALTARRKQVVEMAAGVRGKKSLAADADALRTTAPDGKGTAEFAEEIERLASASSVDLAGTRFGAGESGASVARTAASPQSGANPQANPQANPGTQNGQAMNGTANGATTTADANGDGGWKKVSFECTVIGPFTALTGFMDRMIALRRVFEITSVQVTRSSIDEKSGALKLQLKLSGALYGMADRS